MTQFYKKLKGEKSEMKAFRILRGASKAHKNATHAEPLLPELYPDIIPDSDIDAICNKYRVKGYNISPYHLLFLNKYSRKVSFKGKRVLEIGGSNLPSELVLGTMGAEKWVCIDTDFRNSAKEMQRYEKITLI